MFKIFKNKNEFAKARIKFTIWYALIGVVASAILSLTIYRGVGMSAERALRMQYERLIKKNKQETIYKKGLSAQQKGPMVDAQTLIEIKQHVFKSLIFFNIGALLFSGIGGFYFSSKTLEPIKKAMRVQKQFMSDASHELKTPLTALKTEIEVNLRDKNLDLKKSREVIKSNLEEVNKLTRLTQQLLTSSGLDEIEALEFQNNDIAEIVKESVTKVLPLAKKKEIKIKKEVISKKIVCDKDKITELLVILLDNAVKYSGKNSEIEIKTVEHDKGIKIFVKDYGTGINEKDAHNIFDRFYRAEKSRHANNSFGLGLAIAKQIVTLHDGNISVHSSLGRGSTFVVSL